MTDINESMEGSQNEEPEKEQDEELVITVPDEELKIRREIADDFYVLISRIKTPFNEILTLRNKKIRPGSKEEERLGIRINNTYFLLNEEEEQSFLNNLTELNETLGASDSALDSYVRFDRSSPDFKKFLNMFWIFMENYTTYRASYFFQSNAEKGYYLYPYFEVDNVLVKLQFLFARLCGTLSLGARWIIIQPPASRSSGSEHVSDIGHAYNEPYNPYISFNEQRPKSRDIGDAYDVQR